MSEPDEPTQDGDAEDTEAQELLANAMQDGSQEDQQEAANGKESFDSARAEQKIRKANNEAANLRRRLKEYEDRDKTEQQKLTERAETAERQVADYESRLLRAEIAAEKGLTTKQARRLQGSTREELETDADELLSEFQSPKPPAPDLKQGQRGDPNKSRQLTRGELANMNPTEIMQARRDGRLDDVIAGRDK